MDSLHNQLLVESKQIRSIFQDTTLIVDEKSYDHEASYKVVNFLAIVNGAIIRTIKQGKDNEVEFLKRDCKRGIREPEIEVVNTG